MDLEQSVIPAGQGVHRPETEHRLASAPDRRGRILVGDLRELLQNGGEKLAGVVRRVHIGIQPVINRLAVFTRVPALCLCAKGEHRLDTQVQTKLLSPLLLRIGVRNLFKPKELRKSLAEGQVQLLVFRPVEGCGSTVEGRLQGPDDLFAEERCLRGRDIPHDNRVVPSLEEHPPGQPLPLQIGLVSLQGLDQIVSLPGRARIVAGEAPLSPLDVLGGGSDGGP